MKTLTACVLATALLLVCAQTAPAATSVVAAYEKYVAGQGFDIGLIDTGTGASIPVPTGVNSSADEIHPALSSDGRWLVFSRMTLTPQLNGNVVPPAERSIIAADRTGSAGLAVLQSGGGAGPTATAANRVTWGKRPTAVPAGASSSTSDNDDLMKQVTVTGNAPSGLRPISNPPFAEFPASFGGIPGIRDVVSAVSMGAGNGGDLAAYQAILIDDATGDTKQSVVLARALEPASCCSGFFNGLPFSFTGAANTGHPALRTTDRYLAFDESTASDGSGGGSIRSVLLGAAAATLADAPSPINTSEDERQPAWSPDNTKLAFVRSGTAGQRKLLVFDLTAGIQTIVNPELGIGALAPNPQLRRFQNVWGGISLAIEDRPNAANPVCDAACRSRLSTGSATLVQLSPAVVGTTVNTKRPTGLNIGIVVARVIGSHKVLGRTVPKLRRIGRVPLGAAAAGRNDFRWDGRVAGRRLPAGTYALTFRTLTKSGRIHSVSQSVRFTVSARGRISAGKPIRQ